jgi:chromatin segregation and condensation protein Rec8/ScpA/Scc1 (kleisin family)
MTKQNGFATKLDIQRLAKSSKKDIKSLEKKMDKRFEQVDKRFEEFSTQFRFFRQEMKDDWEINKKDMFREFEHRWQQQIDPILKDIQKHREKEIIMGEQYSRIVVMFERIANKVGVSTEI